MTEEEQKLYDVIADWWDEVFVRPQNPKTIRNDSIIDLVHAIMDTEKFQEELSKQKVFDADKFAVENSMVRNHRILDRYNMFYNTEVSGLTWGTHITPEFQQAMTLECMLDALRYENFNHEFDSIPTADINDLIDGLYQQGKDYLERVKQ